LLTYFVFIFFQQENNTHIMPEGQPGPEALTAARNKKCLDQILATTYNMTIWQKLNTIKIRA